MALISFNSADLTIPFQSSGVGFFGSAGFGYSIPVGQYNGRSFITDSTGTSPGGELSNNMYNGVSSVILGQIGSGINCLQVPNYLSTFNARFTNGAAVMAQNCTFCVYDGVNTANAPSGVNCLGLSVIHPNVVQDMSGSGNSSWQAISGLAVLNLPSGPGLSGLSPNGINTVDYTHDFWVSLSVSPTNIGSHTFSGLLSLEYL